MEQEMIYDLKLNNLTYTQVTKLLRLLAEHDLPLSGVVQQRDAETLQLLDAQPLAGGRVMIIEVLEKSEVSNGSSANAC